MEVTGRPQILGLLALALLAGPLGAQGTISSSFTTFREAHGLSCPVWDETLARSAQDRAAVLAADGVLSHVDHRGRGPGLQMADEGLGPGEFGEVLGAGADPTAVWEGWLASPTHRAVLSAEGWTKWGWGVHNLEKTRIWVLRFWKP